MLRTQSNDVDYLHHFVATFKATMEPLKVSYGEQLQKLQTALDTAEADKQHVVVESKVRFAHYVAEITRQNLDAHNLEMTSTHADSKETKIKKSSYHLQKKMEKLKKTPYRY